MDQLSAHLDRGWDLAQRGDPRGAGACARQALELSPDSPEGHNLLGYAAAMTGEAEEAIEHYRQAIALDESYFEAMLNATEILISPLGEFQEALSMIDDAIDYAETPEEIADCLLLRVDALMGLGEKDEARKTLQRTPAGPYTNPNHGFLIGRAHYELGEVAKATPLLEEAAKSLPDSADANYYMGLLHDERGESRFATEAFLKARMLDAMRPPAPWIPKPEEFGNVVKGVLEKLEAKLAAFAREAEVFVVDLPGAELVVDGVDPRAVVVIDRPPARQDGSGAGRARIFVYQRNLELVAGTLEAVAAELLQAMEKEISLVFVDQPTETPTSAVLEKLN